MTQSIRLLDFRARNGDSPSQVALSEIMAARAEGREPDVHAAHVRAGTLPTRSHVATRTAVTPPAPARAATPPAPAVTQWDVTMARESASQSATARERQRWAKVFASEHSHGREQGCAILLANEKAWSADVILAELPTLPTDSERARTMPAAQASADAVWDRVNAKREASNPLLAAQRKVQGTAYEISPKAAKILTAQGTTDAAWERAYGNKGSTEA